MKQPVPAPVPQKRKRTPSSTPRGSKDVKEAGNEKREKGPQSSSTTPTAIAKAKSVHRCEWVNENNPTYVSYHDTEWGVPMYESNSLFELLCLEGQVAGLSWLTVLTKREAYRRAFHNFNPRDVAKISAKQLDKIIAGGKANTPAETVIRHRGKLEAIITNAKAVLDMERNNEPFDQFIWSFIATPKQLKDDTVTHEGKPKQPRLLSVPVTQVKPLTSNWKEATQAPTRSTEADSMSSALKARGFAFVGPVTCHSFMQAAGLRNDHIIRCAFRRL